MEGLVAAQGDGDGGGKGVALSSSFQTPSAQITFIEACSLTSIQVILVSVHSNHNCSS